MHTFNEATVDEDLSVTIASELGPLGIFGSAAEYGDALFAIVASTCSSSLDCPKCGRLHLDQPTIWRRFCANTLGRLRSLVEERPPTSSSLASHVVQFAAIYQRIIEYSIGGSLLDVGSSLGLLPVLLAERFPNMRIVGCDNRPDAIVCATNFAAGGHNGRVTFLLRDVLAPDFADVGRFDTVTAIHLLEHLTEDELPLALIHMLQASARRMIIAVPYEEKMELLYGHQQVFTREKLLSWGRWCIDEMGGGNYWCEQVMGGMLVVERAA
jgi:2-polyprenyl-3-methyl-5-hydroxy-6-metoxy-1,4-benzoquinol methylase